MVTRSTAQAPTRYRFSVETYERMGQLGILDEDERVELIDGEIIQMSALGDKHVRCVNRFTRHLSRALGERAIVSIQNPVVISPHDEPQPDVAVLQPSAEEHAGKPRPPDVLFLVEVSDSTLRYDRTVKLPLYARGGIPEVWIADLAGETITRYAAPEHGRYRDVTSFPRGESITSHAISGLTLRVDDLLP
jgi:Uma2 family endonuclease